MGMISTLEMLKMPTMILTATPPYLILTTIYLRTHYQSLWKSHCPHSSALAATHNPVATYMPAVIFLLQPRPYWLMAWLARHKIRKASFFFLFIHYSRATYGDHGEIMYSPVSVRCPRSGGTLLAPLLPSAQAYPVKI